MIVTTASTVLMSLWLFTGQVLHTEVDADVCARVAATLAAQIPVVVRVDRSLSVRAVDVECSCPIDDLAS